MASNQYHLPTSLLSAVLMYWCLQPSCTADIGRTPSQVFDLLSSYSLPVNQTMETRFLEEVRESEAGLCSNLTLTENTVVNTSLITLHIRRTNDSSIADATLKFPCTVTCSTPVSKSPVVELSISNTISNMSCLSLSRFVNNFGAIERIPLRLSDVLSVSLYDPQHSTFINLSQSDAILLQIPLAKAPNSSNPYVLECLSQGPHNWEWSNASCLTNQTTKVVNDTSYVQCNCSTLGTFAVFVKYFKNGGSPGHAVVKPSARLSLTLDADCTRYLPNATIKAGFLNSTKYTIATALNTSVSNIVNMEAECGSIVVNFTLISRDGTNQTLNKTILHFGQLLSSNLFKITIENARIYPYSLRVLGETMPGLKTFISLYYYRKFATQPTTKRPETQPLQVDYTPFMVSVAVVLSVVMCCICYVCCSHSWYLRKKKFTEFNSNKPVPKVDVPVVQVEEEDVAPPEFPMTYTVRQKVNEREMLKYDWARTSFAHEQTNIAAFVTPQACQGPRLIVDCESDDESEGHPPSEGSSVTIDLGGGSGLDSDDGSEDEGNFVLDNECDRGGELVEDGVEAEQGDVDENQERGINEEGLAREQGKANENGESVDEERRDEENEDEVKQKDETEDETKQPDKVPREDEEQREDEEPREDEGPRDDEEPREDEKPKDDDEPREDDEPRKDGEPREDEEPRDDEEPREDDEEPREDDEPRRNEETENEPSQDGKNDEDNKMTYDDPEISPGTESRAASGRSDGRASSRLSRAMPPGQGMPEPSM